MRFLHTSDWQLGMTRHFLGPQAQADFASARLDAVRRMASLAAAEGCACCVVAGDVFESNQVDRQTVARALEALGAFGVPVLLLPGNHDAWNAASIYRSAAFTAHCPPHVRVLATSVPVPIGDGSVEVVGAPWTSKEPTGDLVGALVSTLSPAEGVRRVVVGHGQIREGHPTPEDPTLISLARLEEALADGRIAYVALGDRHSLTEHGTSGRVWHSGTPVQTDYDEVAPNHALVVDLTGGGGLGGGGGVGAGGGLGGGGVSAVDAGGGGVRVVPHRVSSWSFVRRTWQLDGRVDLDQLGEWLEGLPAKHETVVKVALVGSLSFSEMHQLDELLERYAGVFAALETWERHSELVGYADDADLATLDLSGYAKRAADRLGELAASGTQEARTAADALRLLYRLVETRTVGTRPVGTVGTRPVESRPLRAGFAEPRPVRKP